MTSLTPFERFSGDIERHYGILPTEIYVAPRGFAAETYYVDTKEQSFFLKIMNNPRRQAIFKHGLQVVEALVDQGIDYIPRLIKLSSGDLYFEKDNAVAALYTRIEAKQSYHYDRANVFKKLAQIYHVSAQFPNKESFMKETFNDRFISAYEKELQSFMNTAIEGDEAIEVRAILQPYADFLTSCPTTASKIVSTCREQQVDYYLTHSDFTNNVMISGTGQHYLIDFDEAIFGPLERDGFLCLAPDHDESKLWLSVMKESFPEYQVNKDCIQYYLYERFMVDLTTFMQESLHHPDLEHRRKIVTSTKDYLMGWLYPMMN